MVKIRNQIIFLIISLFFINFLSVKLFADPYLSTPEVSEDGDYLVFSLRLNDGLTTEDLGDRLVIIEQGATVRLTYQIEIYRQVRYWFDERLEIDNSSHDPFETITIERTLEKQLFFHEYNITEENNIDGSDFSYSFASPDDLSEAITQLRSQFFNTNIRIRIQKNRLRLSRNQNYYIRVRCEFEGIRVAGVVDLFDRINFVTEWINSNTFQITD